MRAERVFGVREIAPAFQSGGKPPPSKTLGLCSFLPPADGQQRDADEVTCFGGVRLAPEGVQAFNPAFDVTPAELISAIVTEKGVVKPPYEAGLRKLLE